MKMHSHRFKDPAISRALPVTILTPLIEETMRLARIQPDRDMILDRFMAGHPRIAVVHGSEDHPPNIGSRDTLRRLVRQLWTAGALPIEVIQAIPCEELTYGLPGSRYAFLGRNVWAANLAAQMEAHCYDAAVVMGACDKMMIGALRALVEVDLARQQRKARPVYAVFLPTVVGRKIKLNEGELRRFDAILDRLSPSEAVELFELIRLPVNGRLYERVKACLDECFGNRSILESEKDELERIVAARAASAGAASASSRASIVTRLMIATFGLVPQKMDISTRPPRDEQLEHVVERLVQGIHRRERRISVAQLTRSNLQNAVTVWSATGGHPSWFLHLNYLAEAVGVHLSANLLRSKMTKVPFLMSADTHLETGSGIAAEADAGGNSGIDTLMRTLSEKRFVDDRAATLDGTWMSRIMEARSANGKFFQSTMTPSFPNCGLARVHGNLCETALVRLGCTAHPELYDQKVYLADFYLGQEELREIAAQPEGVLGRIRKRVNRDDLYRVWSINWGQDGGLNGDMSGWNKRRLWEYLFEQDLLRVMIFVGGEGPHAAGMPVVRLSEALPDEPARRMCLLATDGRVGPADGGMSIVHIVPEAIDGGALASVRAGDWIYLDLNKGEFQAVTAARKRSGYRVLRESELVRRADLRKRVHELERRRAHFLPSVRSVFDSVSSAAEGVSPITG